MTLRPDSVVQSIIYDEKKAKATSIRVIDAHTKQMTEYCAKIHLQKCLRDRWRLHDVNIDSKSVTDVYDDYGPSRRSCRERNEEGNVIT